MRYSAFAVALTLTTVLIHPTPGFAQRIDVPGLAGAIIQQAIIGAQRRHGVVIQRRVYHPPPRRRVAAAPREIRRQARPVAAAASAPPPYEGTWGLSGEQCQDKKGPNGNTFIGDGIFDQHEFHCRIGTVRRSGAAWTLNMACVAEGQKVLSIAKISLPDRDTLVMEQTGRHLPKPRKATYQRCAGTPTREARPQLPPAPVAARPAEEAPSRAEARRQSTGTGFFVGSEGQVLTNAHVVEGCRTVAVRWGEAQASSVRLLARDETNDLALLKTDLRPAAVASMRNGARLGESIAAFGYPLNGLLATSGNFTLGNITAVAGVGDDTRHLQISAPVQPGNSGGPLLDQSGNVVGVVVGKLNAIKLAVLTNDVTQNVNFAIKASVAASFLEANSVPFTTGTPSAPLDPADIADRAKTLSVFLECRA